MNASIAGWVSFGVPLCIIRRLPYQRHQAQLRPAHGERPAAQRSSDFGQNLSVSSVSSNAVSRCSSSTASSAILVASTSIPKTRGCAKCVASTTFATRTASFGASPLRRSFVGRYTELAGERLGPEPFVAKIKLFYPTVDVRNVELVTLYPHYASSILDCDSFAHSNLDKTTSSADARKISRPPRSCRLRRSNSATLNARVFLHIRSIFP